jgi:hypothetical protein
MRLAPIAAALLLFSCSERSPISNPSWADYQAVVAHCAGSWRLSADNDPSNPGAPECVDSLVIVFQPPAAFSATGPYGSATITLCGTAHEVTVTAVHAFQSVPITQAGTSGPAESGSGIYGFMATLPEAGSQPWSVFWWPTQHLGEPEREALLIQFCASPFFARAPGASESLSHSACLAYERDS